MAGNIQNSLRRCYFMPCVVYKIYGRPYRTTVFIYIEEQQTHIYQFESVRMQVNR